MTFVQCALKYRKNGKYAIDFMSGGLKKREKIFLFQFDFLAHGFHIKLLTLDDYLFTKHFYMCSPLSCYDVVVHNKFIFGKYVMSMNNTS